MIRFLYLFLCSLIITPCFAQAVAGQCYIPTDYVCLYQNKLGVPQCQDVSAGNRPFATNHPASGSDGRVAGSECGIAQKDLEKGQVIIWSGGTGTGFVVPNDTAQGAKCGELLVNDTICTEP